LNPVPGHFGQHLAAQSGSAARRHVDECELAVDGVANLVCEAVQGGDGDDNKLACGKKCTMQTNGAHRNAQKIVYRVLFAFRRSHTVAQKNKNVARQITKKLQKITKL
jgi:hypothetical protein